MTSSQKQRHLQSPIRTVDRSNPIQHPPPECVKAMQLENAVIKRWEIKSDKGVWLVQSSQLKGKWALKNSPKSIRHWTETKRICEALRKNGAPVPQIRALHAHREHTMVLLEWVGVQPPSRFRTKDLQMIGIALASLHRAAGKLDPAQFPSIPSLLGEWPKRYQHRTKQMKEWIHELSSWNQEQARWMTDHASEWIDRAELSLKRLQSNTYQSDVKYHQRHPCLCHQDFSPGNLRKQHGKLVAIDWDSLVWDSPARDLRKILIKIASERGWHGDWTTVLLNAYRSIHPIPSHTLEVLKADLLFPHRMYGWIKSIHRLRHHQLRGRQKRRTTMTWLQKILSEERSRLVSIRQLR